VSPADPLVSILTPSFNQALWLKQNLQSVAGQSYPHVQHIVMDGGSTDGSVDILRSAGSSVMWRSEADDGQSDALNRAFQLSSGEIIGWINSDDAYFGSQVVQRVVEFLKVRPAVDVVYGHGALVNSDGLVIQMMWVPPFNYSLLRTYNFIIQPTVFIRRSALGTQLANPAYDYTMDRELWLRLARNHSRFQRLPIVVAIDRHHAFRKSYLRADLAHIDTKRLAGTYGVTSGRMNRVSVRLLAFTYRLLGLGLVTAPKGRHLVFGGVTDSTWRLGLRQAFRFRRMMPIGSNQPGQAD